MCSIFSFEEVADWDLPRVCHTFLNPGTPQKYVIVVDKS